MKFRNWCREKWYQHMDEYDSYNQPVPHTAKEYFAMYKYWLKREYRYQHKDTK